MKIEPHQKCSSRMPPVIGPRPMPSADTPAHTPIALPRSSGSVKTLVMIDSVDGMMNAPPMPISARVAISASADGANADSAEPTPKIDEADGEEAVATEAVAEAAGGEQQAGEHEDVRVDDPLQLARRRAEPALRAPGWASVGMATLRIVLSSVITIRLMQSTSRVSHRRR